jgi:hypothetical protein
LSAASVTGNITGNYFLGNVFFANGITASKIYSGNSEVNVVSDGGNVNVSINGTPNIAVFTETGEYVTGAISASTLSVSGNVAVNTSSLKVDTTNNRVGVVNASPSYPLDATGNVNSSTGYYVGGTQVATVSSGNLSIPLSCKVTGRVYGTTAGQAISSQMYFCSNGTATIGSGTYSTASVAGSLTTWTSIATISYTPVSTSSYIIVHADFGYTNIGGNASSSTDHWYSQLSTSSTGATYFMQHEQYWAGTVGYGSDTRSPTLSPILGAYSNSTTSATTIYLQISGQNASDDPITPTGDYVIFIREIAR